MSIFRQLGAGFTAALVSSLMVFSALSLAAAEGLGEILPAVEIPTLAQETPGQATFTPAPTQTSAPPTNCPPPEGWVRYIILNGDTLEGLAAHYGTSAEEIIRGNCLFSAGLIPGKELYLPPLPTGTPTALVESDTATPTQPPVQPTAPLCGPPNGWVKYRVQPGDNLFRLSLTFGVSVAELQFANCLGNSVLITVGEELWVPFIPVRSPTPQPPTATSPPTNVPTATQTPVTPSATPETPSPAPSDTPEPPTVTPSDTPMPPTETPSDTPNP